jgi:hypothetical protein
MARFILPPGGAIITGGHSMPPRITGSQGLQRCDALLLSDKNL